MTFIIDAGVESNKNERKHPQCKDVENKRESPVRHKLRRLLEKFRKCSSVITVEPFIVCYLIPSLMAGLSVQNLCLEKACLVDLHYDNVTCAHIMSGTTLHHVREEREVQNLVAGMTAWNYPLQSALPGILVLFVGAWSDRTHNRKAFMLLPILGKILSVIGMLVSAHWLYVIGLNETALMDGLPPALTGGRVAMTLAVYSYVSDVTKPEERTTRLGVVTTVLTLSRPIGLALSGVTTRTLGYYGVFTIATALYVTGFLYVVVWLKKTRPDPPVDTDDEKSFGVFSAADVVTTFKVAVRDRGGTKRVQIILILVAYVLIVGPVLVEAQMTYWFSRYKFKFTEVDNSLFLTYSVLVTFIGSIITIYVFTKRWQLQDSTIGVIAGVSRVIGSAMYAFSPTRALYYTGPIFDMFSSAGATALRSIITKLVDSNEIGRAGSLVGISEALIPVVYGPLYSYVYKHTLEVFPGSFYLISTALAIPAICIFIILYKLQKNSPSCTNDTTQTTRC